MSVQRLDADREHDTRRRTTESIPPNNGFQGDGQPIPRRGLRTRDWLRVREEPRRRLPIDPKADPREDRNPVDDPVYAEPMDQLDMQLVEVMERTGDAWYLEMDLPPPRGVSHEQAAGIHGRDLAENVIVEP